LSNICAGIGRGQMLVLQEHINKRRTNNLFYRQELASVDGVLFHTEPDENYYSNYWLTAILVDPTKTGGKTREDLRLALAAKNIETRPLWKPMHLQPVFKKNTSFVNGVSEKLFDNGLCLPSSSNLTDVEMNLIVDELKNVLKSKKV